MTNPRSESEIQNEILRLATGDVRLFRNNTGQGWVGQSRRFDRPEFIQAVRGDVLIRNARPLHAGLCTGSSDLIGWQSVTITPDMIGQTVAVFVALEVKSESGRVTTEQRKFIAACAGMGGLAGAVKSVDDAMAVLSGEVSGA